MFRNILAMNLLLTCLALMFTLVLAVDYQENTEGHHQVLCEVLVGTIVDNWWETPPQTTKQYKEYKENVLDAFEKSKEKLGLENGTEACEQEKSLISWIETVKEKMKPLKTPFWGHPKCMIPGPGSRVKAVKWYSNNWFKFCGFQKFWPSYKKYDACTGTVTGADRKALYITWDHLLKKKKHTFKTRYKSKRVEFITEDDVSPPSDEEKAEFNFEDLNEEIDGDCTICYEDLVPEKTIQCKKGCRMCKKCITEWLSVPTNEQKCPTCRHPAELAGNKITWPCKKGKSGCGCKPKN